MSSFNWSPLGGGSGGSGAVDSVNSLTGALTIAAGAGISVSAVGTTITVTNTAGGLSVGTFGSTPNVAGLSLAAGVLTMQPADATNPGGVSTGTQTFAGNKTFSGTIAASNLSGTNTGDVTIGTASGLSLAGQALSLGLASAGVTGALSGTDWSTFNSKQAAGNYITALTGDVTASGPGSVAATVALVGGASAANVATATALVNTAQSGRKFLASPDDGSSGAPAFRAIVVADVPTLNQNTTGTASNITASSNSTLTTLSVLSLPFSQVTGTVPVNQGGTGQTTYTDGQLLIGNSSGNTLAKSTLTAGTGVSITNGAGSITVAASPTAPSVQSFTSGSGTYTTPAGVLYIEVEMVGGGGGGSGSGTASGGTGGTGGNTTFGTTLLAANGGAGGIWTGVPGVGGAASLGTGPVGMAIPGGRGGGAFTAPATGYAYAGGIGGASAFGGAGSSSVSVAGTAGATNSGAGGGGGGYAGAVANGYSGTGGGSGGYVKAIITSPSATYAYAVGAAGSAGTAGTNGTAGGAGAAGIIIVREYRQ